MSSLKGSHIRLTDDEQKAFKTLSDETGAPISWHLREAARSYLRGKGMRVKPATLRRGRKGGK